MSAETDFEPYVAEPSEPAPTDLRARRRPLVGTLAAVVALLAVGYLWFQGQGQEDPSLQMPIERLEQIDPGVDPETEDAAEPEA